MSLKNPPRRRSNLHQATLAGAVASFFERLERRELLAAQVWANDNWALRSDAGPEGLSIGDVVESTGAGDSGSLVSARWGIDAFDTIADAVSAVDAGGTVNVLAGAYADNLDVNKAVNIVGQGAGTTVLRSAGAADSIVLIRHSGVSISRITLGGGGSLAGGPDGGTTVGIDINGGSTSINNATISGNDIGVRVRNGGSLLSMQENFVTNNAVAALEVQADAGAVAAVFNNDLSGPGMAVTNAASFVVNASGNYFGADTTQAGVAARNTLAGVDFTPWLNVGTDTSANSGFQGQFTDMNVGAAGQQSGAVGRVREGVTLAAAGGNVFVHAGTYGESDINLDKAVTIDGVGAASGVVIAPAVADAHATAPGSTFAPGTHNAFVVRSGDVTIKDLTIDGDAGVGGAGAMNFFGGVVYDYTLGSAFNNLQAKNLTVRNVWRVGIYFDGGINALSTGHTVMGNAIDNVSGGSGASAILMLQASGAVTGNTIMNVDGDGVATNYIDGVAFAPTISIKGNAISGTQTGMNLSGLASGSAVGGGGAGDANTITMTGGGDDTGIVVQYAVGTVTVEGNTITGDGDDSGIWLYHNESAAAPAIVGNTLTATVSTSTGDGDGTGVFVTDDGSFFTESSGGNSFATISGNVISGFFRGIDLFRNEDNPAGGFTVNATIDANNKISGGNTGVRAFDSNGTTAADAVANITGNNASIHGNAIGIDVAGGTAIVTNNHIYDNGVGVQVRDGGVATINNNDFDGGADDNDTDVLIASTAPAGIGGGGAMSGNTFAGSSFFVDNESTQSLSALASAGNTFAGLNNFRIEDRIHHGADTDRPITTGLVTWVAANRYVTAPGAGSTDSTIQRAVDLASAGDTVHVEAGTYNEDVTVDKTLTLLGSQANVDPRPGRAGPESILLGTGAAAPLRINAGVNDVLFNGFTVQSPAGGSGTLGAGIYTSGGTGTDVRYNVIENNTAGVAIGSATAGMVTLNVIRGNNAPGASAGTGVSFFAPNTGAWAVTQNAFRSNDNAGVLVAGAGTVANVTVSDNQFTSTTGGAIYAQDADDLTISGNAISGAPYTAIEIAGGVTDAVLNNNTITGGETRSIFVHGAGNANVDITNNTITQNAALIFANRPVMEVSDLGGAGNLIDSNVVTLSGSFGTGITRIDGLRIGGAGTGGIEISNNELDGGNVDTFNGADDSAGITLEADLPGTLVLSVHNNKINHWVDGVSAAAALPGGANVDVNLNDLSGNLNRGVRAASTGAMIDASLNWWGTATSAGVTAAANGGVNVDNNPWLGDGTDTSPARGFQPNLTPLFSNGVGIAGAGFVDEGSLYTLTLTDDGTSGTITSWTIDWGDGAPQVVSGNPATVTHTYADGLNNYNVTASATNDELQTMSSTSSVAVQVDDVAPTIAATGAPSVNEGDVFTLNLGNVIDPGTDTVTSYVIHWGDGNSETFTGDPSGLSKTHTYADDDPTGTASDAYTITIDLRDEDSAPNYHTGAGSAGLTVNNVAPAPAIVGSPASSPEGTAINLTSAENDPGAADSFTYAWSVTKNGNAYASATTDDFAFTPNDNATYVVSLTVTDDDTGAGVATQQTINVTNVAPTIPVTGNAGVNEGSSYTLTLGNVVDPGNDTVTRYIVNWGDGDFADVTGSPNGAVLTHTYDDGTQARNVTVSLFDEDAAPHANAGTPDPFAVTVNNVAPTGNLFNGGPVPEGSAGLVGFGAQFDPSAADTAAGFRYSYDFNNDGDFTDALEHSDITNAAVGVPFVYLNDGPGSRTIRARIKDKDGGFTDYTTTINIFNVTPAVNVGPDVNAPANIAWSQSGTFSDPGADAPWTAMVDYDWHPGDNDAVPLALSGFNFTLNHSYASPGTYAVRVFVTDKDGATGFDELTVNVGPAPTFQVNQFLFNTSGLTLRFNRPLDTANLNLYDGLMGTTPSAEAPDLTLVGNSVGAVRGSVVWDPATNLLTFVRTGGPLEADTYTLTVRSASNAFKDTTGGLLDGDANGSAGDDYVQTFNATNFFDRTLSVPDFARGPDAGNNVNVPNTGTLGIPVRIDDGAQVRSVDFRINYNPALLNITAAQLAAGMPGDWAINANLSTPGVAIITVFGTTTDLPSGPQNIVKLIASVPNNAPYQAAGTLRFSNMTTSRNDATTISTRGDSALHKVMYFGDADGDRAYTGFDAGLLSRVVVNLDSGFHASPLVDPVVVGDIDGSGALSGIDASFVAQKAALLPRAEIPDLPGVLPPLVPGGVDPLFRTPDNKPGRPGGTVTMPISIDDAAGTLGYNLTIDYETSLLDLANADVQLGSLYATAGGWSLVTNVDEATGHATLVFWRTNGMPMPPGSGGGEVARATFTVATGAAHNASVPINLDGNPGGSGLEFTFDDGSVLVDAVAPTVLASNYKYETAPHKLEFQFSEDVFASLAAGDFVVVNNTTTTTIPSTDFTLAYNATTNTATLSYVPSGGVLPDGNYTVTITAANVTDAAGNPLPGNHALNFFFLMADANHDGAVNLGDFNILAANFGQSPRDFTQGDFTYDGVVNLQDFNILAARFGAQLGPGATILPPTGNPPALPPGFGGATGAAGATGAIGATAGAASTPGSGTATTASTAMPPSSASTTASRPAQTTVRQTTTTTATKRTSTSPFSSVSVGTSSTAQTDALAATSPLTSLLFASQPIGRRGVVRPA